MLVLSRSSKQPVFRCTASTRSGGCELQRDIDAAAQLAAGTDVEPGDVGIDAVADAPPHHDADALHDMVAAQMDRVLVGRKYARCDRGAIDFLDGDHIGVEFVRIAAQQVDVLRLFRTDVGGQIAFTGGEPFEVPGRQLQFRANGTGRQQQEN